MWSSIHQQVDVTLVLSVWPLLPVRKPRSLHTAGSAVLWLWSCCQLGEDICQSFSNQPYYLSCLHSLGKKGAEVVLGPLSSGEDLVCQACSLLPLLHPTLPVHPRMCRTRLLSPGPSLFSFASAFVAVCPNNKEGSWYFLC